MFEVMDSGKKKKKEIFILDHCEACGISFHYPDNCASFGHLQSVLTWKILVNCHLRVLQFL